MSAKPENTQPKVWSFLKGLTSELSDRLSDSAESHRTPFVVGGNVRDALLGGESFDVDLVVEEKGGAEFWAKALSKNVEGASEPHPLGAGYPIWQVLLPFEGQTYEIQIADSQKEMFPDPQSRQRIAVYGSLEEDCLRRDFTVNMLYWDLQREELRDLSAQGVQDIQHKILRCHSKVEPRKIFKDDPLRILRLFRLQAQLGFRVDSSLIAVVKDVKSELKILSAERVRDEILKLKTGTQWKMFFESLAEVGVLAELFPELEPMRGCEQDSRFHAEGDVWVHTMRVLENSADTPLQLLTALLHDTGKVQTQTFVDGRIQFLGHEKVSEKIAKGFLKKWAFPRKLREEVCLLVRLHLRGHDVAKWKTLKPARKLLRELESDFEELLLFLEADARSSVRADGSITVKHLPVLREKLTEARANQEKTESFLLSGHELMKHLGLEAGPELGLCKQRAQEIAEQWTEEGKEFSKQELLAELAKKWKS